MQKIILSVIFAILCVPNSAPVIPEITDDELVEICTNTPPLDLLLHQAKFFLSQKQIEEFVVFFENPKTLENKQLLAFELIKTFINKENIQQVCVIAEQLEASVFLRQAIMYRLSYIINLKKQASQTRFVFINNIIQHRAHFYEITYRKSTIAAATLLLTQGLPLLYIHINHGPFNNETFIYSVLIFNFIALISTIIMIKNSQHHNQNFWHQELMNTEIMIQLCNIELDHRSKYPNIFKKIFDHLKFGRCNICWNTTYLISYPQCKNHGVACETCLPIYENNYRKTHGERTPCCPLCNSLKDVYL